MKTKLNAATRLRAAKKGEPTVKQIVTDAVEYLVHSYRMRPQQINNGRCEDFAFDIFKEVLRVGKAYGKTYRGTTFKSTDFFTDRDPDNPMRKGSLWDVQKLKQHWPKCVPPHGYTWDDLQKIAGYGHAWYFIDGLHYDAETPEGTPNFFEFPMYLRNLAHFKNK